MKPELRLIMCVGLILSLYGNLGQTDASELKRFKRSKAWKSSIGDLSKLKLERIYGSKKSKFILSLPKHWKLAHLKQFIEPYLKKAPEPWYYQYHGLMWEFSYIACKRFPSLSKTSIGRMGHGRNMLQWYAPRVIWWCKHVLINPAIARASILKLWMTKPWVMPSVFFDPRGSNIDRAWMVGIGATSALAISMLPFTDWLSFYQDLPVYLKLLPMIGATKYCNSSTGSNAYNGNYRTFQGGSNGPWQTMTYADATMAAGDTVNYEAGMEYGGYAETLTAGTAGNIKTHQGIGTGYPVFSGGASQIFMNSYTRLQGFDAGPSTDRIILIKAHTYVYIQYCTIHDTTTGSRQCINVADGIWSYIYIENNTLYNSLSSAILLEGYNSSGTYPNHAYVTSNEAYNCYGDQIVCHDRSSVYMNSQTDIQINNNLSRDRDYTNDADYYDLVSGHADCLFYDNEARGSSALDYIGGGAIMLDNSGLGWTLYRNWIHDTNTYASGVYISTPNVVFWGNLVDIENTSSYKTVNNVIIIDANQYSAVDVTDVKFYKNTIIYSTCANDSAMRISNSGGNLGAVDVSYNIFSSVNNPSNWIRFHSSSYRADDSDFTADKNVYDTTITFAIYDYDTSRNWTWWTGTGLHDTNGATTDPLFTDDTNGDYTLTTSSPARGLGPGTSTYQPDFNGLTTDNDAGAYEFYTPPIPPPATTTWTLTDITFTNMNMKG